MRYDHPVVLVAGTALEEIQGAGGKTADDFDGMNQPEVATASAYEADE